MPADRLSVLITCRCCLVACSKLNELTRVKVDVEMNTIYLSVLYIGLHLETRMTHIFIVFFADDDRELMLAFVTLCCLLHDLL